MATGLWRNAFPSGSTREWGLTLGGTGTDRFDTRLPSADAGLYFAAEFTLHLAYKGRGRRNREQARNEARLAVQEFAGGHTQRYSLADTGLAETHLSRALIDEDVIADATIRAGTITVRLSAAEDDIALVKHREHCIPRREVEAEEHRSRMARLQRMAQDVYGDPITALRWWYDNQDERVGQLDEAARQLHHLLGRPVGRDGHEESVGEAVDDLLSGLDPQTRRAVVHRIAEMCRGFSRRDLAKRLHATHLDTPP